jgi:predicted Zn-dependent protease
VAATILKQYKALTNAEANRYVNLLGQALAMASDKPETFAGYHFLILDTEEVNAFAAPGGFILVSRGLLRCCNTEDAVAALLAHEIGHVQHGHGMQAIQKSRITSAFTVLAAESARTFGRKELVELTQTFEDSIGDVFQTLVNSGYSRQFEIQSDQAAVTILDRVGYNPRALNGVLLEMSRRCKPGEKGFGRTHPDPAVRMQQIAQAVSRHGPVASPPARQARFEKAIAGI